MSILDPDKKVEEEKLKHAEIYQSSQHPEYFSNEGSEFDNIRIDDTNEIKDSLNFDKILGNKNAIQKNMNKEEISDKEPKKEMNAPIDPEGETENGMLGTA